ncbi:unnamed protein product [Macrosiphum euphorbiae]|uniref:YqaJ viral recombinase domain-containing protein n=2 Tax=Macrosiphum euphorbiae TaxID=13131 RepID=A0AAV0VEK6_9HEMI|nr:unnamed protein product [Macrosiphum euphorbiae]
MFRLKTANFNAQQEEHFDLAPHDTSTEENSVAPLLLEDDRSMPGPSGNIFSNVNEFTPRNIDEIESHVLSAEKAQTHDFSNTESFGEIIGRRIVDLSYIFAQIKNVNHDIGLGCSFIDMDFVSEDRRGCYSECWFICKMCNIKSKICTVKESPKTNWSINKAIVNSTIAIGIGYTQVYELLSGLEIPSISSNTYTRIETLLGAEISNTAWSEMEKAGQEEKRLAIESGCVGSDGIPMITVVADGQWSKRSYRTKYDALSGVASIIGYNTKKVLFVGIRNRYCVICERSNNKKIETPNHFCFLNWKQGATSIEADAIAEGFKRSIEIHGVKYSKLIGDGDSSVTKRLNEILPYGPICRVQKVECRNHLLRNYSQKLMALSKRTDYPIKIRKKISANILRLRTDITCAIRFRKLENKPLYHKVAGLRLDIANAPNHRIFEIHKNCSAYFCKRSGVPQNIILEGKSIRQEIDTIVSRLSNNAESLIMDVDNNACEQFNSVINKFLGGKRINFTQKSSYSTRVQAAVISYNSGEYLRSVKKYVTHKSPGKVGKQFLRRTLAKRYTCQKKRKSSSNEPKLKSKRPKRNNNADEDYGHADPLDNLKDVNDEQFINEMNEFVRKLGKVDRVHIEKETRDQASSELWKRERLSRLTGSNFGRVCKMRQNTSCKNTVHSILYSNFTSSAVQFGKDMEQIAINKFEEMSGFQVKPCGLHIDEEYPYLAASPDGVIDNDRLIEVKAPYAARSTINYIEAVETGKLKYCTVENEKLKLKENNIYYYQIQGQLHITKRKLCFFIVYSPQWISVEEISYDDNFWTSNMEDKLQSFYWNCLLPEIVDPAFKYRLLISDIRDPKTSTVKTPKAKKKLF